METVVFIIVDLIIFAGLVFGLKVDWIIAFFASTVIAYALWHLYYILMWEK